MEAQSRPRILVTGGTGFLGKRVVPLLREHFQVDVVSRGSGSELQGDLSQPLAGMNPEKLKSNNYQLVLHMAALYDLKATKGECEKNNILALRNIMKITDFLEIPFFVNMSSVAAAINVKSDVVGPYHLNFDDPFPDPYAESKAVGEEILSGVRISSLVGRINLRLGVLVGDSVAGHIDRIDGPYNAPQIFSNILNFIKSTSLPVILPGKLETELPLVPVDEAAIAVSRFCEWALVNRPQGYQSYNLTPKQGLPVKRFYSSVLRHLGDEKRKILLLENFPQRVTLFAAKHLAKFPEEELRYLLNFPRYDSEATSKILGSSWCSDFSEYENIFWRGYEAFISQNR